MLSCHEASRRIWKSFYSNKRLYLLLSGLVSRESILSVVYSRVGNLNSLTVARRSNVQSIRTLFTKKPQSHFNDS